MATKSKPATPDEALGDLASLASALAAKAEDAVASAKIKNDILERIGDLDEDTAKALLKDPRIERLLEVLDDEKAQAAADRPGTITSGFIGGTRVAGFNKRDWTEADLMHDREGAGKLVTFTPHETIPVFWNGIMRQFVEEQEMVVEKCFVDIYNEHRRAARLAKEHAEYLFHKRDTLSDISMITAEGARARGLIAEKNLGWFVPGGGSIVTGETAPARADVAAAAAEGGEGTAA